jgi:arylsulfatase A-like enzyme
MRAIPFAFGVAVAVAVVQGSPPARAAQRPNIILVMSDDQGWGQTGYYNHPLLKTPNLDAMARGGLRFDRFYAGAPVCSPTRASVLTGRSNDRTGVPQHGCALRLQELTLAQALRKAGYATGHFGKWHLNGLRGPGAPILEGDTHHPGHFGFYEWLSVTNFFDMNPLMSRGGKFEEFEGDSSEVIVGEVLKFVRRKKEEGRPFFAVVWYGTPHSPWRASEQDARPFAELKDPGRHHHGELVAMDRSLGTLRRGLRELGVADDTLVWFNSDNGGLTGVGADTVGGLRGKKGTIWEGGLRVPCVVEWPARVAPRVTSYPASTMDIMPTIVDLVGLPAESMLDVVDGVSLKPLFEREIGPRTRPIPFLYRGQAALVDNDHKMVFTGGGGGRYLLYDLRADPKETKDISAERPEVAARLRGALKGFMESVERSRTGADYPEGRITSAQPQSMFWWDSPAYEPYLEEWTKRPEYQRARAGRGKGKRKKK